MSNRKRMTNKTPMSNRADVLDLLSVNVNIHRAVLNILDEKAKAMTLSRSALLRQILIEALQFRVSLR